MFVQSSLNKLPMIVIHRASGNHYYFAHTTIIGYISKNMVFQKGETNVFGAVDSSIQKNTTRLFFCLFLFCSHIFITTTK